MEITTIHKIVLLYRVKARQVIENIRGANSWIGQTQKVVSKFRKNY